MVIFLMTFSINNFASIVIPTRISVMRYLQSLVYIQYPNIVVKERKMSQKGAIMSISTILVMKIISPKPTTLVCVLVQVVALRLILRNQSLITLHYFSLSTSIRQTVFTNTSRLVLASYSFLKLSSSMQGKQYLSYYTPWAYLLVIASTITKVRIGLLQ